MDEINDLIKNNWDYLSKLYELECQQLRLNIDCIIEHQIKDINVLEKTLDRLLNIPTEKGYLLFQVLCEYVSKFDKSMVDDYVAFYNNIYGEDECIKRKKKLKNNSDMV